MSTVSLQLKLPQHETDRGEAVILGGGIGGLSAAAALARVGIEGEICEQSETLREGNAIRVLRQLGLEPRLCRFNSRTLFRVQDLNQIVDK